MMTNRDKEQLIKGTSKADQKKARDYCNYYYQNVPVKLSELNQCYVSHSKEKEDAYNRCRKLCSILDGYDFYISSHTCNFFSVVFKFRVYNRECYAYITYKNDRFCYAD